MHVAGQYFTRFRCHTGGLALCSAGLTGLGLDVGDFADVEAVAKTAIAWQGHVDILFNNAGGGSGRWAVMLS